MWVAIKLKASHFSNLASLDGSKHLLNFEIVRTQVEMLSEADDAFLHVHLDHVQLKSVARLHNNLQVTRLVAKLKLCKNLS